MEDFPPGFLGHVAYCDCDAGNLRAGKRSNLPRGNTSAFSPMGDFRCPPKTYRAALALGDRDADSLDRHFSMVSFAPPYPQGALPLCRGTWPSRFAVGVCNRPRGFDFRF